MVLVLREFPGTLGRGTNPLRVIKRPRRARMPQREGDPGTRVAANRADRHLAISDAA